jgi:hypothetical protein
MAGLEITNYEYSINAGSTWTAISPPDITSPVTISGLTNGTAYTVYLRAVNTLGGGKSSSALSINTTPRTTPSITSFTVDRVNESRATYNVTLNYGGDSTTVTFQRSTDGSNFTDETPTQSTTSTTADLYYNKTELTEFTDYWLRVKATNAAGTVYSSAVQIKTWGLVSSGIKTANGSLEIPTVTPRGGSAVTPSIYQIAVVGGGGAGGYTSGGGGGVLNSYASALVTGGSNTVSWTIGSGGTFYADTRSYSGGSTSITGTNTTISADGGTGGQSSFPSSGVRSQDGGASGSNVGGNGVYDASGKELIYAGGGGGGANGAGGHASNVDGNYTGGNGGAEKTAYGLTGGGGGAGVGSINDGTTPSSTYGRGGNGDDPGIVNDPGLPGQSGAALFKYYAVS